MTCLSKPCPEVPGSSNAGFATAVGDKTEQQRRTQKHRAEKSSLRFFGCKPKRTHAAHGGALLAAGMAVVTRRELIKKAKKLGIRLEPSRKKTIHE